jgi:hypothetical protein
MKGDREKDTKENGRKQERRRKRGNNQTVTMSYGIVEIAEKEYLADRSPRDLDPPSIETEVLHLEICVEAAERGGEGRGRNKGGRCSVDLDAQKHDHGEEMAEATEDEHETLETRRETLETRRHRNKERWLWCAWTHEHG